MKNITRNNLLIAEFMGYENINPPNKYPLYRIPEFTYFEPDFHNDTIDASRILFIDTFRIFFDDMKFNSDWNWLMVVLKRIREVVNTELSVDDFDKYRHLEHKLNPYNYGMESIYKECIEFIKWYNENN